MEHGFNIIGVVKEVELKEGLIPCTKDLRLGQLRLPEFVMELLSKQI